MSDDDNCVGRGYFGQQDLMINGWMFCIHGLEWCNRCGMDHRMCNNIQIEDDLTEEQMELLTDYGLEDFQDREQIKVTNKWKQLSNKKVACTQHSAVGCSRCFDFKQQILNRLPALQAKSDAMMAKFHAQKQQQQQQQQQQQSGSQPRQPAPAAAAGSSARAAQSTAADVAPAASPAASPAAATAAAAGNDRKRCWCCSIPKAESPDRKLHSCAGCKRAKYCSVVCQSQHWPDHKQQCKQWKAEAQTANV